MTVTLGDALVWIRGNNAPLRQTLQRSEAETRSWSSSLGGKISGWLGGSLKTAAGFLTAQVATKAFRAAISELNQTVIGLNSTMEDARARIFSFVKSGELADDILRAIREEADKTPFAFVAMAEAVGGLIPSARLANEPLMDLVRTAEILAAANPAQGLSGAAFALREAVAGDFMSVINRFDLPRYYINKLKEEGVPNLEIVRRAMSMMGYDMDLVSNMSETLRGRWDRWMDSMDSVRRALTQPLFDQLKLGLTDLSAMFDDNKDKILAWAGWIGEKIGELASKARQGITRLVGDARTGVQGWITELSKAENSTITKVGTISGFVSALMKRVVSWGSNIVVSLAEGIVSAVGLIVKALQVVGRVIAFLLKPGSPPRLLPNLREWARATAEEWLDGWSDADFSTLQEFGSLAQRALQSLVLSGQLGEEQAIPILLGTREEFARVIQEIKETGVVSEETFARLRTGAGVAGEELETLARHYARLVQASSQLRDVNEKLREIQGEWSDQTDQIRLSELNAILLDPRATQQQKDLARSEKDYISLMMKQRDLQEEVADAQEDLNEFTGRLSVEAETNELLGQQKSILEQIAEALGDGLQTLRDQLRSWQLQQEELDAVRRLAEINYKLANDELTVAQKTALELEKQAVQVERIIRAKEAADLGVDLTSIGATPIVPADFLSGGGTGGLDDALDKLNELQTGIEGIDAEDFSNLTAELDALALAFQEAFRAGQDEFDRLFGKTKGVFSRLVDGFDSIIAKLDEFTSTLDTWQVSFDKTLQDIEEFAEQGKEKMNPLTSFVDRELIPILSGVGTTLTMILGPKIVAWAGGLAGQLIGIIGKVGAALAGPLGIAIAVGVAVGLLVAAWQNDWLGLRTTITGAWNDHIKPAWEEMVTFLDGVFTTASQAIVKIWQEEVIPVWEKIKTVWDEELKPTFEALWGFIDENILPIFTELKDIIVLVIEVGFLAWVTIWNEHIKPFLTDLWTIIKEDVFPVLEDLWKIYLTAVKQSLLGLFAVWTVLIRPIFTAIKTVVAEVGPILTAFADDVIVYLTDKLNLLKDALAWIRDNLSKLKQGLQAAKDYLEEKAGLKEEEDRISRVSSDTDGYATGTNFFPGGYARVGELGEELVKLPKGTAIIPHNITEQISSRGGKVEIIFTGDVIVAQREDREMLADDLVELIEKRRRR